MLTIESATYVGAAKVAGLLNEPRRLLVTIGEESPAPATLALSTPYKTAVGDKVLVIRHEGGEAFVIGVLGTPREIMLEATHAVHIKAPHVHVRAGKFELTTRRIIEKARDVYRWVSDLFQVKSRRMRTVVETDYHMKAGTANLKAEENVNIDGKSINLG